jgi:hypothetical protein
MQLSRAAWRRKGSRQARWWLFGSHLTRAGLGAMAQAGRGLHRSGALQAQCFTFENTHSAGRGVRKTGPATSPAEEPRHDEARETMRLVEIWS